MALTEEKDKTATDLQPSSTADSSDSSAGSSGSPNAQMLNKKTFAAWKVVLPVVIGITVVALMIWHDAKKEDFVDVIRSINFTPRTVLFIIVAFLFMFGRDFGLTWRFRALTDHKLTWLRAYKVDMLCEFTSCVTPSAVGGSSLGMVFLWTQGINFGRATTLMMTTLFLDELFFVVSCPIVALLTPAADLYASGATSFSHGIKYTFWIIYAVLFAWTLILFLGIIVKPLWIRSVLVKICSIKFLKRWQNSAASLGESMIATSKELKSKKFGFWLEVFGGTALSWMSRYLVVNALFLAFIPSDDPYAWVIFARQLVIWVVLMVSPTPGGSGLSEWLFSEYYGDLVTTAGMALILAVFWRLISYYLYLIIGSIIVPSWLKSALAKINASKKKETTSAA